MTDSLRSEPGGPWHTRQTYVADLTDGMILDSGHSIVAIEKLRRQYARDDGRFLGWIYLLSTYDGGSTYETEYLYAVGPHTSMSTRHPGRKTR